MGPLCLVTSCPTASTESLLTPPFAKRKLELKQEHKDCIGGLIDFFTLRNVVFSVK
jgi:hypothetical protein